MREEKAAPTGMLPFYYGDWSLLNSTVNSQQNQSPQPYN